MSSRSSGYRSSKKLAKMGLRFGLVGKDEGSSSQIDKKSMKGG